MSMGCMAQSTSLFFRKVFQKIISNHKLIKDLKERRGKKKQKILQIYFEFDTIVALIPILSRSEKKISKSGLFLHLHSICLAIIGIIYLNGL